MKIKNILTAATAGLTLLAVAPTGADAALYDVDTVAAQTTGGAARGPVNWYDSAGHGNYAVTLSDTSVGDNACVKLEVRRRFQSGAVQSWIPLGSACSGRSVTWTGAIGPNGTDSVRVLDFRVTRLGGFNNSDIYSVSPGGA